jgi:hypothetical protein
MDSTGMTAHTDVSLLILEAMEHGVGANSQGANGCGLLAAGTI